MAEDRAAIPEAAMEHLMAGHEALAEGRWGDALRSFESSLDLHLSPEALEGVGMACWWIDDPERRMGVRRRAYRMYRRAGDPFGAARTAVGLAMDHFVFKAEHVVARGWTQRARSLLEGEGDCPERGWLAIWDCHMALFASHDPRGAAGSAELASELGKRIGDIDVEMLALAYLGLCEVSMGAVEAGMGHLDEATTAALAGEMSDVDAITTACCCMIYACERTMDLERAAEWCQSVKQLSEQASYKLMFWVCRTHHAGIQVMQGQWVEAEAELERAFSELTASHPAMAAESLVRLAELRRRQGRLDEAVEMLRQMSVRPLRLIGGVEAWFVRAEVELDAGRPARALERVERYLRALGNSSPAKRAAGLSIMAEAAAASGDIETATRCATELAQLAGSLGSRLVQSSAARATAAVRAASGHLPESIELLREASDLADVAGAPFEAAGSRVRLAEYLMRLGKAGEAEIHAREALDAADALGATGISERARAVLKMQGSIASAQISASLGTVRLSPREREVLAQVATGASNQEIAAALFLSVRTVERHLSNVYDKIGLSGRSARAGAAAFAVELGLGKTAPA